MSQYYIMVIDRPGIKAFCNGIAHKAIEAYESPAFLNIIDLPCDCHEPKAVNDIRRACIEADSKIFQDFK